MQRLRIMVILSLLLSLLVTTRCGNDTLPPSTPACAPKPDGGVLGTFQLENQYFWVSIANPVGIEQAIDAWQGRSRASIPIGRLVCQPIPWNCGWSWYLDPQTAGVSETAVELCDGGPPLSQADCLAFSRNSEWFCPWGAKLVALRDCRTDSQCPMMPR
jgi:hypothetical protein